MENKSNEYPPKQFILSNTFAQMANEYYCACMIGDEFNTPSFEQCVTQVLMMLEVEKEVYDRLKKGKSSGFSPLRKKGVSK